MRQIENSLAVRYSGLGLSAAKCAWLAAISLLFFGVERAHAEPELTLTWSPEAALSACPDHAWAMARVESELGRSATSEVQSGVRAIVAIEKRAAGLLLSLRTEVEGAQGERVIEGDDCRELSEAAILIVALSVTEADEARVRERAASSPAPNANDASTRNGTGATERQLGFVVRPELVVELGILRNKPMLGPGLAIGLTMGRYRVEAAGTWLLYGQVEAKGEAVSVQLGSARVSGCALFGKTRVRGGPCLGVELGQVKAESTRTDVTFWGAASATARLWVALGFRLALLLDADLMASWGQVSLLRMENGQSSELFHSLPVQLRTHLGLELSF